MSLPTGQDFLDYAALYFPDNTTRRILPVHHRGLAALIAGLADDINPYSGNLTVHPTDLWEQVVEGHDGNGIITFANGAYTATHILSPAKAAGGLLDIRAANIGGATLSASWKLHAQTINMANFNLITPATGLFSPSYNSFVSLTDCTIDALAASSYSLYMYGGQLLIAAVNRPVVILLGDTDNISQEADANSMFKFAGNVTPGNKIIIKHYGTAGEFNQAICLDSSGMLLAGVEMYAMKNSVDAPVNNPADANTADRCHGIAIDARRGQFIEIQDTGNIIQGFMRGIDLENLGHAHINGIAFNYNSVPIRRNSLGAKLYFGSGTTFVGNSISPPVQDVGLAQTAFSDFSGALVSLTADETTADYTVEKAISWTQESGGGTYDVGAWFDPLDPTKLTIPAALGTSLTRRVKVGCSVDIASGDVSAVLSIRILKTGSFFKGYPKSRRTPGEVIATEQIESGWTPVVPGTDYFKVMLTYTVDNSITLVANGCAFWIELEK